MTTPSPHPSAAAFLEIDEDHATAIADLGVKLVLHTAQGLDLEVLDAEFDHLRATYLQTPDSVRMAALTFTTITAEPLAELITCDCEGPDCTNLQIAFAQGGSDGSLEQRDAAEVPEPMRTIGRVIGAHVTRDLTLLGELLKSVPPEGLHEFTMCAFQMAVAATRQKISGAQ